MKDSLDQVDYGDTVLQDDSASVDDVLQTANDVNISHSSYKNIEDNAKEQGQRVQYFMLPSVVSTPWKALTYALFSIIVTCVGALIVHGFSHGWDSVPALFPLDMSKSLIGTAVFTLPYIIVMVILTIISHIRQSYKLNRHSSSSQPPENNPIKAALVYPLVIGMPVDDYTNHNFIVRQRILAVTFESLVSKDYVTVSDNTLSIPDMNKSLAGLTDLEKALIVIVRHILAMKNTKTLSLSDIQDVFAEPITNKKLYRFMEAITDRLKEVDKSMDIISGFPFCNILVYPLPLFAAYFLFEKNNIGWIIFGSLLICAFVWCFVYEPNNTLGFKGHSLCKKWNPFINYIVGNPHEWQNPENRIYAAAFAQEYPNHTLADLIGIHLISGPDDEDNEDDDIEED